MASRSGRPATRSRTTDASSGGAVSDVSKFLQDLSRKTTRSSKDASVGTSHVRAAIERRVKALGHSVGSGLSKISVTDEYIEAVEKAVVQYVERLLGSMVTVSLHRAGLEGPFPDLMGEQSLLTEEWLLHKEDQAAYMRKILQDKASYSPPAQGTAPEAVPPPPELIKSDYSTQAQENDEKLLVTARSVRRVTLRDLLPLLASRCQSATIPARLQAGLMNRIAVHEVNADYRNRVGLPSS